MAMTGVEGVEVGVYDLASELSPERVAAWDALGARYGLPVVALLLSLPADRWPRGALTGEPEGVAAQVRGVAAICAQRALPVLGLWPGADPPGAPWERLIEGMTLARDAAAAAGTRVAVEYKPGTVIGTAEDAVRLAADVPGTGVLLDTGHAYAAGEDPAEVARRLGGLLWHVHLGDAALGRADDDLPVGHVHDFSEFVRALDEIGYEGVASFDLYGAVLSRRWTGASATRASLAHLRGWGSQ
jgi:sugar phosphate isomerase/epimerase